MGFIVRFKDRGYCNDPFNVIILSERFLGPRLLTFTILLKWSELCSVLHGLWIE